MESRPADSTNHGSPVPQPEPVVIPHADKVLRGSVALKGLFVLALLFTLALAKDVLMPLTLALIIAFLFSPLLGWLQRRRVPKPVGAALVVLSLLGTLIAGVYFLAEPAKKWMAEGATVVTQLQQKVKKTVSDIEEARQQVEQIITPASPTEKRGKEGPAPRTSPLAFSLVDVVATAAAVLAQVGWMVVLVLSLTYMILISEDTFRMRLVRVLPNLSERKRALYIVEGVKQEVASYLATITVINLGVGIAVGVALHLTGMPNAVLWGALAFALNYLPYIGPISGMAVIGLVGLLSFDNPADALLPVALYLGIHGLESQVLTPAVLGRRMTLNPAVVFIAIVVWGWLWGIVGAVIAVPMLAIFKVFCDHIDSMAPLGELLSGAENRRSATPPLTPPGASPPQSAKDTKR